MDSHALTSLLGPTECHTTTCLKYWIRALNRTHHRFVVEALVKVPGGVRFLTELRQEPPEAHELIRRCLENGEFSARPYLLGQTTDDSTADCVMALYEDCCRRRGLDPSELLVRTYPGWEKRDAWLAATWTRIRDSAQWQETTFPAEWTSDCLIGLLMSLTGQHRPELATILASVLAG